MKLRLLFFCLLLVSFHAFAQKEYNTWYFGDRAGITFNTNLPSALTDGVMYTLESSSSICDESGNLLFYTDGDTVWNKHHTYMKNTIQSPYYFHSTSSQGSVIIKKPGSDHLFYIFCSRSQPTYSTDCCVRYWLIDMNGDDGAGEVIKMNESLPLLEPMEGLAITKHANEMDIWIGAIHYTTGVFSFVRTINGELDQVVVPTNIGNSTSNYFPSKFSPNSKVLLSHNKIKYIIEPDRTIIKSVVYLHHFDNAAGQLFDHLEIEVLSDDYFVVNMAVEFSHNSRYLYVGNSAGQVIQFDLAVWDKAAIEQSATIIYDNPEPYQEVMGLQLGPDRKIYVFQLYNDTLMVIDRPWLKGHDAIDHQHYVALKGRENQFGAPYYPTFVFKKAWDQDVAECFVPNAFSPNGDGVNDVFAIYAPDIDDLHLVVYNRWGEKVFDGIGFETVWDGTLNGKPCPQDVYVYSLSIIDKVNGSVVTKQQTGNITLLR